MADLFLNRAHCANNGCKEIAGFVCNDCFLVQYCSKNCQKSHWKVHKVDCKSPLMKATWKPSWETEKRTPSFLRPDPPSMEAHGLRKYLWGNVPAVDILKSSQNEGEKLPDKLCFLFAASGDARNVITTFASLPDTYQGHCETVINDRDFDIVARNSIILLAALIFPPKQAVPIILHTWYSSLLSTSIFTSLEKSILPLIEDVRTKIQHKPAHSLQSKTWKFGTRSIRLVLQKKQWDKLPSYLQVPSGLCAARAQELRRETMLAPKRKDFVERAFYEKPPGWRTSMRRFREEGVLLPFGSPLKDFNVPNPTFFQTPNFWPMMDSADPVESWPIQDVLKKPLMAKNDTYGSLFFYVQDMLLRFLVRIERLDVCFVLFQLDARELPRSLKELGPGNDYFDRIEVSNIADGCYLGFQATLHAFAPLLKPPSLNPYATLLTLFLNSVHEISHLLPPFSYYASMMEVVKYIPLPPSLSYNTHRFKTSAVFTKIMDALKFFSDYDGLWKLYMAMNNFEIMARQMGVVMKKANTVVEEWPLRLRDGASQREFDVLLASGHTGSERYVEWKRVG